MKEVKTRSEKTIGKALNIAVHMLEWLIAVLTVVVLVYLIGYEIFKMFTVSEYFASVDTHLVKNFSS